MKKVYVTALALAFVLSGCGQTEVANITEEINVTEETNETNEIRETGKAEETSAGQELDLTADSKDATKDTIEVNSALYDVLDFEDTQEADFAVKGLIDAPETLELKQKTDMSSGARVLMIS